MGFLKNRIKFGQRESIEKIRCLFDFKGKLTQKKFIRVNTFAIEDGKSIITNCDNNNNRNDNTHSPSNTIDRWHYNKYG